MDLCNLGLVLAWSAFKRLFGKVPRNMLILCQVAEILEKLTQLVS